MQLTAPAVTLGWIIAVIALLLVIVLMVLGRLDVVTGGLIGAVAASRIIP